MQTVWMMSCWRYVARFPWISRGIEELLLQFWIWWTAEYGAEVLLVISHITLRRNLHLSMKGALTNFLWVDSWIELLAAPLAPSELGTAVTEAGARASIGNYVLKQPSTAYGSSNFNIKAACTTWKSCSFTPCFIMLPITTFPSESTRRHYWPQWRTNCISITRMNSCRILSHHISSLHVSSCSVFVV